MFNLVKKLLKVKNIVKLQFMSIVITHLIKILNIKSILKTNIFYYIEFSILCYNITYYVTYGS